MSAVPVPAQSIPTHHAITLTWIDEAKRLVGVVLPTMNENDTIAFSGVNGKKAMVKFLSPTGAVALTLQDGEEATFTTGGIYKFQCFIDGVQAADGGGVEILPHKP